MSGIVMVMVAMTEVSVVVAVLVVAVAVVNAPSGSTEWKERREETFSTSDPIPLRSRLPRVPRETLTVVYSMQWLPR